MKLATKMCLGFKYISIGGPSCIVLPLFMTAILSAIFIS